MSQGVFFIRNPNPSPGYVSKKINSNQNPIPETRRLGV